MMNTSLLQELAKMEPFGLGNHQPIFLLHNIYKINAKKVAFINIMFQAAKRKHVIKISNP